MDYFAFSFLKKLLVKSGACMTTFSTAASFQTTLGRCEPLKIVPIFYIKFFNN